MDSEETRDHVHPYFGELNRQYEQPTAAVDDFDADGFVLIPSLLSAELLEAVARRCDRVIEERAWQPESTDPYLRAFRYLMNSRLRDPVLDLLARSRRLAEMAARLLRVPGVLLSHDQVLYKPPGASLTPVHADQYHWPVSDDSTVTAWIPLQATGPTMGALAFYPGSHRLDDAARYTLSAETDERVHEQLVAQFPVRLLNYQLGDVSFHRGWTFHRADGNAGQLVRRALSIVYMRDDIRIVRPRDGAELQTLSAWSPSPRIGERLDAAFNPRVFSYPGRGVT